MSDIQLIKQLIKTLEQDINDDNHTNIIHLFEVMLGFTINRQILEEYLS
tara:strand:+ start:548 stop:694 length:147 start_codon:yes stop_codon:yes gene_type:complete